MKNSFGERWVLARGGQAASTHIHYVWLLLALLFFLLPFLLNIRPEGFTIAFFTLFPGLWLLLALLWWERAQFYRVIQRLERRIEELESQAARAGSAQQG